MRFRVVIHERARQEALDAASYIAAKSSLLAAERWLAGLDAAVDSLGAFPSRCGRARERSGRGMRQLLYKAHRVVFAIRGRTVHVLHVRHAARRSGRSDAGGTPN